MSDEQQAAAALSQLRKEVNAQAQCVVAKWDASECVHAQAGTLDAHWQRCKELDTWMNARAQENDGEMLRQVRRVQRYAGCVQVVARACAGSGHLERSEQLCLGMCIDRYVECMSTVNQALIQRQQSRT